jgi:hypothetical protein
VPVLVKGTTSRQLTPHCNAEIKQQANPPHTIMENSVMKPLIRISGLFLVSLLFGVATSMAQDADILVGIGIGYDPPRLILSSSNLYTNVMTPVNIYVPISGAKFRFEPDLGFYSFKNESSSGGYSNENDASIFHIGAGAFYMISTDSPVRIYIGPRLGLNFISAKSTSSNSFGSSSSESSETDFTVGACVGGEYLFASRFSIGGEAQLSYISFGTPDVTYTPASEMSGSSPDITRHLIASNVVFFFRWFF